MQAIWDQEPVDQRFFRLYRKKVMCVEASSTCTPKVSGTLYKSPRNIVESTRFVEGANAANGAFSRVPPRGLSALPSMMHAVEVTNLCTPTVVAGGTEHELVEVADLDNPLGYKGNYIIFPLKHSCHLTDYMLSSFIDNYLGLIDPDGSDAFVPEDFEARWVAAEGDAGQRSKLRDELIKYLTVARRAKDEIIVPTGQLFIEALPGSHALLEDFKLLHRAEDVRKVKAEVRHAELENLRLASRLAASQGNASLLEDPDIEKKVVVSGAPATVTDS
jgi:hypothetical protein